ncbi:MAG: 2-amino-4-oxopentanoate thiolase subunit OrtA [Mobilicoccus sp.]|nr:2-amino-4-oxopentanoate thiolase subunit OrtA [Mobilicoccus sp.]
MSGQETRVPEGTWVEIERVLLTPEQRASNLPPETAAQPYVLRLNGFLTADAAEGEEVTVRSLIGHEHTGRLVRVDPSYDHSFGRTVPELLRIGLHGDTYTAAASSQADPATPAGGEQR